MGIETRFTTSHNQIRDLPGDTDAQKYRIAKLIHPSLKPNMQSLLRQGVWGTVIIVIFKRRWAANCNRIFELT